MKRDPFIWISGGVALVCAYFLFLTIWDQWPASPVIRSFPTAGVRTVVLRAAMAPTAEVVHDASDQIQISGLPEGGAEGYHSPEPFWRPTSAKDWGLDFVARQYGSVLVISTQNEIGYIHHQYQLGKLSLRVPKGVQVTQEEREPTGDGTPSLAEPGAIPPALTRP